MKIISYIFSYEREEMLKEVINEHLLANIDFIIVDDGSTFINDEFWNQYTIFKYNHTGKEGFLNKFNDVFNHFLNSKYDSILCTQDDVLNLEFDYINQIATDNINEEYIFNTITDHRKKSWINVDPVYLDNNIENVYFTDCNFFSNRITINKIWNINKPLTLPNNWFKRKNISSGVGYIMSHICFELFIPIYRRLYSIGFHGNHLSKMHPEERLKNPIVSINKIKIICNIATMNSRIDSLKETIQSLENQTIKPDEINIYNNDIEKIDYTDNAKFYFLNKYEEPVYYFTMDDDIIYGEDYIEKTIKNIEIYKCIITYHGRLLNNKFQNYYEDHLPLTCKKKYGFKSIIDVPGTGVTAFRTDYFNPNKIYSHPYKRMSDCLFGLEAKKQNKDILFISDEEKPIIILNDLEQEFSCYTHEKQNTNNQNKICKKIFKLKKES